MASHVITGDSIRHFRMAVLAKGLKLECLGMTRGRRLQSCYSSIKQEFGLKGTKQQVYEQFIKLMEQKHQEHKSQVLQQCPYDSAIKCLRDEPCEGCEDYRPGQEQAQAQAQEGK